MAYARIEYKEYGSTVVAELFAENATQALIQFRKRHDDAEITRLLCNYYAEDNGRSFEWRPDNSWTYVTHVWSSFGHAFNETTGYDESRHHRWTHESCNYCGAEYNLVRYQDDPRGGDYQANNGDDPIECTGTPHEDNVFCNCLYCK